MKNALVKSNGSTLYFDTNGNTISGALSEGIMISCENGNVRYVPPNSMEFQEIMDLTKNFDFKDVQNLEIGDVESPIARICKEITSKTR